MRHADRDLQRAARDVRVQSGFVRIHGPALERRARDAPHHRADQGQRLIRGRGILQQEVLDVVRDAVHPVVHAVGVFAEPVAGVILDAEALLGVRGWGCPRVVGLRRPAERRDVRVDGALPDIRAQRVPHAVVPRPRERRQPERVHHPQEPLHLALRRLAENVRGALELVQTEPPHPYRGVVERIQRDAPVVFVHREPAEDAVAVRHDVEGV